MSGKPNRMMSVDLGRRFMLAESPWFDVDMLESSVKMVPPAKKSPSAEKVKHTICVHAINAFKAQSNATDANGVLEYMWFTYGMLPCQFKLDGRVIACLVSVRGICWVDTLPYRVGDADGMYYGSVMRQVAGVLRDIRHLINDEYKPSV